MFAAEEPGGFSTILTVAQSDLLKVLTIELSRGEAVGSSDLLEASLLFTARAF
jgi:hypothetical protein